MRVDGDTVTVNPGGAWTLARSVTWPLPPVTLVTVRVTVWLPATSEMPIDGRLRSTAALGTPLVSRKSQLPGVKTPQSMPQVKAAYSNRPAS